ncbi:sulfite reductase subunit alpha [Pontibacillus halophilus JSM 076056 = DSM 19796]|uniref:assimilatory sulfite reductase (NADPH) n=1 Tax=Pontibacillus halophilus JSM 076056 = DSM 19796 TaxID=1385510 RepID=A0A0A5GFT2_9BACI|nr:assimilatory sulfite reductase (NADPH) flavoprotein subunit [Pontibacillus halophilus]KGX92101.1 sulfite reductase subunit alpha [Pontibacillus halophilus JSM 076056 = DSM 19796]
MTIRVTNSPFNENQVKLVNELLPTLTEAQSQWLSGYLAAVNTSNIPAAKEEEINETEGGRRTITILYGSQTGNAKRISEDFGERLEKEGFSSTISALDDFKTKHLKNVEDLLIVTSTHGDGDPPDNAMSFYDYIFGKRAPDLSHIRFSVLALGDTSYDLFCETGKEFDERLEQLKGERLIARVDCDLDFEEPSEAWFSELLQKLREDDSVVPSSSSPHQQEPTKAASVHSRGNPFYAEIIENINLNGRGSNKETRHIELDLEGSGLEYEPGDSVGIFPQNDPVLVQQLLEELGWTGDELVSVNKDGEKRPVRDAFTDVYEITSLTKPLLEKLVDYIPNEAFAALMEEERETLKSFMYGRDLLDLIKEFGPLTIEPEQIVSVLRKMPPRLYSIASSLRANPDEVHLTIGALRYDAHGRARSGVCSIQCAERSELGDQLPVFIQHNPNFKLPEDTGTKIIMIGAGTGIAPYRAFMEEREEIEADGESWLFFGEQHFVSDFLYQVEWQNWLKEGILTRMDVAFSRDQVEKVYVQHKIKEQREALFTWLKEGAYVYVCGDETYMAKDVHQALAEVLMEVGEMNEEEAESYLTQMRKEKRYQRDVY